MMKSLWMQGSVIVAVIGLCVGWVKMIENGGRQKERAAIERKATQNANKADAARRSVEAIPAGKLRDRYFRD